VVEEPRTRFHGGAKFQICARRVYSVKGPALVLYFHPLSGESCRREVRFSKLQILLRKHPHSKTLTSWISKFQNETVMTAFLKPAQPYDIPALIAYYKAQQVDVEGATRL
jgi:hypothetical protein